MSLQIDSTVCVCLLGVFAIASLAIFVAVMVALISVVVKTSIIFILLCLFNVFFQVSFAVQSHLSVVVMTDHCSSNTTQVDICRVVK